MSDWLLRQTGRHGPALGYAQGVGWNVPEERSVQAEWKAAALQALAADGRPQALTVARWLRTLPVTGRVSIARADAPWLQANPAQDPLLRAGDTVTWPAKPRTVTVVDATGQLCQAPHRARAVSADYLVACEGVLGPKPSTRPAWAWVAQPDGRTSRVGTAPWSLNSQAEPAPGAWLVPEADTAAAQWAPLVARFLAAQGPAPDCFDALDSGVTRIDAPPPVPRQRPPRGLEVTASDWGEIGLLQTPTARMAPAGVLRLHWSHVWPYSRGTVMMQPLDWLEGGIRYTDIANRLYGPVAFSGNQSYKDKSIDVKVRLLEEDRWQPQVSVGARDLGGTGLFSAEYLVASKRHGDLDFSLGLGWGYLGAKGDFRNPLSLLSSGFDQRVNDVGQGGTVAASSLFRGHTALFGGVQWHTPWRAWWLKAEWEGNDYQSEPQGNIQPQSLPINLGLVWRPRPGFDFGIGWERGRELMLSLTLESGLGGIGIPKFLDPPMPRPAGAVRAWPEGAEIAAAAERHTGWQVARIDVNGPDLHVHFADASGPYRTQALEKAVQVLDAMLPSSVERFVFHFGQRALQELSLWVADRRAWNDLKTVARPPSVAPVALRMAVPGSIPTAGQTLWEGDRSRSRFALVPSFGYILGGPDAFFLYQLGVAAQGQWALTGSTWASGMATLRLLDNFDRFRNAGASNLPRVRTYQREYVTSERLTLTRLQLSHVGQLSPNHSYLLYGGWLEPMFAGVGAEWMWRPPRSPVAFGIDINKVHQRDFAQDFSLRDYKVVTGHGTLYWNTGWQGLGVSLSAGQYLAGDRGATLEVSRTFSNGVVMGAYATKTNVSAAQFGEGSFDKGIFLSVPVDAILPRTTNRFLNVHWSPLTRDGGAKLWRGESLYRLTRMADSEAFRYAPAGLTTQPRTGEPFLSPPPPR